MPPSPPMSSTSRPGSAGPIISITVTDNQFVKAGDLLFEIDPMPYQDAVDRAAAQKIQTQALPNRLLAASARKRSTKEQVDEAVASDKSAESALTTAQYDLDGCKVVAPFDGFITNLNISNGAYAHVAGEVHHDGRCSQLVRHRQTFAKASCGISSRA